MKTLRTSAWFQQWLTKTDQSDASVPDTSPSVQTQTFFSTSQADHLPGSGALQKRIQWGLFSWGEQLTYYQEHSHASQETFPSPHN
jgi:hypothetical protein